MARRKAADRSAERGVRRAETNAVAAHLTALRTSKVPARSRATLEKRRAQIEQWIAEESSPIREAELIQQSLDIDAQLALIDQVARLPELEEALVSVAASWAKRSRIVRRRCASGRTGPRPRQGPPLNRGACRAPLTRSCPTITMASVMIDEIRLRAHARHLEDS